MTTTLSMTGCAHQPGGGAGDGCTTFQPVYLSEDAIAALKPFRDDRKKIGDHNETWERVCVGR